MQPTKAMPMHNMVLAGCMITVKVWTSHTKMLLGGTGLLRIRGIVMLNTVSVNITKWVKV